MLFSGIPRLSGRLTRLLLGVAIVVALLVWGVASLVSPTAGLATLGLLVLVAVGAVGARIEHHAAVGHAQNEEILVALGANRRAIAANGRTIAKVRRQVRRVSAAQTDRRVPGPLRYLDAVFEQVQATINLFAMVDVEAPVPPFRHWAVSPDALNLLLQEMLTLRPRLVVECGSGSSTLFLALVARQYGIDTRIVALDHEQEYARRTNDLLAAHGVDHLASVRLAPLLEVTTDRGAQPWYDLAAVEDLTDIGLLFVDGPPGPARPLARYPALPVLWSRLASTASIVVDDSDRDDETEIIGLWEKAHPELVGSSFETEKGTYTLRRG